MKKKEVKFMKCLKGGELLFSFCRPVVDEKFIPELGFWNLSLTG